MCVMDSGMNSLVNLFSDLVKLQSVTAKRIFYSLLYCLGHWNDRNII
jgi:hypothetical protein